jgi:hypothetical protein
VVGSTTAVTVRTPLISTLGTVVVVVLVLTVFALAASGIPITFLLGVLCLHLLYIMLRMLVISLMIACLA